MDSLRFPCPKEHLNKNIISGTQEGSPWTARPWFCAAFLRSASACPSDRLTRGIFYCSKRLTIKSQPSKMSGGGNEQTVQKGIAKQRSVKTPD